MTYITSRFLIFVMAFTLIIPQQVLASPFYYTEFSPSQASRLNKFKNSHEFAQAILQGQPSNKKLIQQAKKTLQETAYQWPQFKVKNKTLTFLWNGQKQTLKHIKGSVYSHNGKSIDLKSPSWLKNFGSLHQPLYLELMTDQAHAVAPIIYFAIWGIVFVLGAGCMAAALGGNKTPSITWHKVDKLGLNQKLNEAVQAFRETCGAAHADTPQDHFFDYYKFLKDHCDQLAQRAIQRSQENPMSPQPINPDGSVNAQFIRHIRYNGAAYGIGSFDPSRTEKISMHICNNSACSTHKKETLQYNNLDGPHQDFLRSVLSDRMFMTSCTEASLNSFGQKEEGIPAEETAPAQEDVAQ